MQIYDPVAPRAEDPVETGPGGITWNGAADRIEGPRGRTRQLLTAVQAHGMLEPFGLEGLALESRDSTQPRNSVISCSCE